MSAQRYLKRRMLSGTHNIRWDFFLTGTLFRFHLRPLHILLIHSNRPLYRIILDAYNWEHK